jgi:tetratricopeptide (TPR) repeat protein
VTAPRELVREGRLAEARAALVGVEDAESLLLDAWCARQLGERDEAAAGVERALRAAPDDVRVWVRAARLIGWGAGYGAGGGPLAAPRPDELVRALALAEHATRMAPDTVDPWLVLHEVCDRLGRPHASLAALRRVTDRPHASAPHLARLARALVGHRDLDAAAEAVARARLAAPDDLAALDLAAEIAAARDAPDAAEAIARAADATPAQVVVHAARWMAIGHPEEAAALVARSSEPAARLAAARLALWAGDAPRARTLAEEAGADSPEAVAIGGAARVLAGDPATGLALLERVSPALTAGRGGVPSWLPADEVLVWQSEAQRRLGRSGPAVATATRAMSSGRGWSLVAQITRVLGVLHGAPDDATRHPAAWRPVVEKLGHLIDVGSLESGRVGPIRDALESVLTRFGGNRSAHPTERVDGRLVPVDVPPHPRALARATQLLLRTRPASEVIARFDALAARFPDDPTPCTYRGETLLWLGRPAEAEASFHEALARDGVTTWAWIGMGASHLMRDDLARAREVWLESVEVLGFEGPTLFPYRAELAWRLGDVDAARRDLATALRGKAGRISTWLLVALIEAEAGDRSIAEAVDASLLRSAPGAWLDAREAGGVDAVSRLRALLTLMRGNRSSTIPGWCVGDELRFLGWDKPKDLALPAWAASPKRA